VKADAVFLLTNIYKANCILAKRADGPLKSVRQTHVKFCGDFYITALQFKNIKRVSLNPNTRF